MDEQLDPSVIALTKAIGHQESGGDYNKIGDNGHSKGAYQWNNGQPLKDNEIPQNFKEYASNIGADPSDFSPANQDRVAYKTVESWGKQGLTPAEIASKWNSGKPGAYKTAQPGYNAEQGVKYDVKSYVDNVAKYYKEYQSGDQSTTDLTKDPIVPNNSTSQAQQTPTQSEFSKAGQDLSHGNILGALGHGASGAVQGVGNALTLGGANTIGQSLGTNLGFIGEKIKGALGGKDNSQYYDTSQPSVGEVAKAGLKTGGAIAAITGGGGLLGKLISKGSALKNPIVIQTLESVIGPGETVGNLSRQEAINTLGNTLKEMSVEESGGKSEQAILKALKELNPTLKEKKNLVAQLAKSGFNLASKVALVKLLGDAVGGAVHKILPQ